MCSNGAIGYTIQRFVAFIGTRRSLEVTLHISNFAELLTTECIRERYCIVFLSFISHMTFFLCSSSATTNISLMYGATVADSDGQKCQITGLTAADRTPDGEPINAPMVATVMRVQSIADALSYKLQRRSKNRRVSFAANRSHSRQS